MRTVIEGKGKI